MVVAAPSSVALVKAQAQRAEMRAMASALTQVSQGAAALEAVAGAMTVSTWLDKGAAQAEVQVATEPLVTRMGVAGQQRSAGRSELVAAAAGQVGTPLARQAAWVSAASTTPPLAPSRL